MKIMHHPNAESLMSCSAGSMPENFAAIMASHMAMCPTCQKEMALMETIGAAMFERVPPAEVKTEAAVMAFRANESDTDQGEEKTPVASEVPQPLVPLIGRNYDDVPWKRLSPGVWYYPIKTRGGGRGDLRLLKVAPGMALPEHAHRGSELTLILTGAYNDETGRFASGDVADMTDEAEHAPIADPLEGCICLVATEGKLRFKSLVAKIVQSFTGI